ncbi:hypothetical protein Anas_09690 [Armadillidium nasatum]|uniref:Transmembrane protein n=1 Tax=Armadillidium nasatum TaxID=96803 RepID=A0A5N5SZA1_9CRUS|nr:hypothetical protein Anas_09690 [Armadillidium nasatum]
MNSSISSELLEMCHPSYFPIRAYRDFIKKILMKRARALLYHKKKLKKLLKGHEFILRNTKMEKLWNLERYREPFSIKCVRILLLIQTCLVLTLESFEITIPLGITGTAYYKFFLYYLSISNIAYMCVRASFLLYSYWLFEVELNLALSSLALLSAAYADIISGKIEFTLMCILYLPLHIYLLEVLGMFLLDNQIDLKAYELKVKERVQAMKIEEENKKTLSSSLFSSNPDTKIWYEGVDDKGTRFTLKRDIVFPHPFAFNIETTIECKYLDGFIATIHNDNSYV